MVAAELTQDLGSPAHQLILLSSTYVPPPQGESGYFGYDGLPGVIGYPGNEGNQGPPGDKVAS